MREISKDIDFLQFVGTQESQFIIQARDIAEEAWAILDQGGPTQFGDVLPWQWTHDHFRLRPGELTIWAGRNGHGKSQILGMVIGWLMKHSKCLVASLEMPLWSTFVRMGKQCMGVANPTRRYWDEWVAQTGNLYLYDQLDSIDPDRILGMAIYAASELGVEHIVIDSLMKCGIATDDYNRQKEFVDRLCWLAKSHKVHIHLVHHLRKGSEKEHVRPDKNDVKGGGEIVDLADNLMLMWRNKRKEEAPEELVNEPDATLIVAKSRHGEWEGNIKLMFDPNTYQYLGLNRRLLTW